MKKMSFWKKNNRVTSDSGVALLMILTSITLLTYIMTEFTFETKLNKFKIYNQQDKTQARLNAESGVTFALAQLRIYKEARNKLDKNKSLQKNLSPSALEGMVTRPFKVPVPMLKGASGLQKSALADFQKGLLLQGELFVQCNPITGFLNPNSLRTKKDPKPVPGRNQPPPRSNVDSNYGNFDDRGGGSDSGSPFEENPPEGEDEDQEEEDEKNKKSIAEIIEKDLTQSLANLLEKEKERDEIFEAEYGDLEAYKLIKELKYYVRAQGDMLESEKSEADGHYVKASPKHAPLSSLNELYLLQGWPDAIINLFKDRLSVHQVNSINLNKLTDKQLRTLFPEITDDQVKEFFKYRDGSEKDKIKPHPFNKETDFRDYIVDNLSVVDKATYDNRKKDLKKAKMSLGVAGNLFKCLSEGKYGRSTYKLETYINLPLKEMTYQEEQEFKRKMQEYKRRIKRGEKAKKPVRPPPELLEPRVVEINIL
jgi:type II secretory pathway component PulK